MPNFGTGKDAEFVSLQMRCQRLEGRDEDRFWFSSTSPSMNAVNQTLTNLRRESMKGSAEPTVLIMGQAGSGHEGVARMVRGASRRATAPWVPVNCLEADSVLDAELFGYEQGGYQDAAEGQPGLIELAKGGTLFFNEISALPSDLQGKILGLLKRGSFRRLGGKEDIPADVRVIVSSSADLRERVEKGAFLPDLHAMVSGVTIQLPELKRRKEDILAMAIQFARKAFKEKGKHFEAFRPDAEKAMLDYAWPGNAHELYHVIERVSLVWKDSGAITSQGLMLGTGSTDAAPTRGTTTSGAGPAKLHLVSETNLSVEGEMNYTALKKKWCDSFEKEYLQLTLNRNHGNVSAAAREAKLDRSNFLRLLRRHGLKAGDYRKEGAAQDDHDDSSSGNREPQAA